MDLPSRRPSLHTTSDREGRGTEKRERKRKGRREEHNKRNMTEDETDVLHVRNNNVRMKMSSLIKQESMVLLHTNEATKTKEVDFSWFLSFPFYSALLFLSTSIFGRCVFIILYVLYIAAYVPGLLLVIARRPEQS